MNKIIFFQACILLIMGVSFTGCASKNYASKTEAINNGNSHSQTEKKIANIKSTKLKLIWADEFDIAGAPNPAKWGNDIGTGTWGWGNNELEYYTDRKENAIVEKGILKIKAIKETYKGSNYTSAKILTKDKFSFKYGKVEVRAKLSTGVGTWPAIWMLGNNISTAGWPACGEIDIMEHKGSEPNKIYSTLHYPHHFGDKGDGNTINILNADTKFHIYTAEWSEKEIKFYVDDVLFKTFVNTSTSPFHQNFYIILNLAMGGNFAGPVDPAITNATMEVDYVRVYQ